MTFSQSSGPSLSTSSSTASPWPDHYPVAGRPSRRRSSTKASSRGLAISMCARVCFVPGCRRGVSLPPSRANVQSGWSRRCAMSCRLRSKREVRPSGTMFRPRASSAIFSTNGSSTGVKGNAAGPGAADGPFGASCSPIARPSIAVVASARLRVPPNQGWAGAICPPWRDTQHGRRTIPAAPILERYSWHTNTSSLRPRAPSD